MKQIWAKYLDNEMNVKVDFIKKIYIKENYTLNLISNIPFRLTIDGEMIGYGPIRVSHGKVVINNYSLSKYINKIVTIKIEAVSYRVFQYYIINQSPRVGIEIIDMNKVIADSFTFDAYIDNTKIRKVQRYSYQRGFIEAYDNIRFIKKKCECFEDSYLEIIESEINLPVFKTIYPKLIENGNIFTVNNNQDYDDTYINRHNTLHYSKENQDYRITEDYSKYGYKRKLKKNDKILDKEYVVYIFDRVYTGFINFSIDVYEDCEILISYDETTMPYKFVFNARSLNSIANREERICNVKNYYKNKARYIDVYRKQSICIISYKLKKGKYNLQTFEPDSLKFIRFAVKEGKVKINYIRFITYENEYITTKFNCKNKKLQLLFNSAVNTFKQNSIDILTDCPSRERAGWFCDSFFTGRAESVLCKDNCVEKNMLYSVAKRLPFFKDIPKEVFPMSYPSDHKNGKFIPNWCMWLILEIYSYYDRTNDENIINLFKNQIILYIEYTLKFLNKENLLENLSGWVFVEWSRANDFIKDINFPTNMLFSTILKKTYKIYGIKKYSSISKKIDEAIMTYSFNGVFFIDNAIRNIYGKLEKNTEWTETCQYYAFYFDYANKENNIKLYNMLFNEKLYKKMFKNNSNIYKSECFIGLYLRLDYLSLTGQNTKLIKDLKKYFLKQAETSGTYWEYLSKRGSMCHGFASIISEWLIRAVFNYQNTNLSFYSSKITVEAEAEIINKGKKFKLKTDKA